MIDPSLVLTVEDQPSAEDCAVVNRNLTAFNEAVAGDDGFRPLAVFVRGKHDEIVAGLVGTTFDGWLVVDLLWVSEALRAQGIGSRLLRTAEQEAINRGCTGAFLDTLSFQAPGFYEKHGYSVFGKLDGLPPGQTRFYMDKRFATKNRQGSTSR